MKVLVSTYPYAGHFNPTQPVVMELVRRGHEVVWMTGPEYEARARATGARFVAMSEDALVDERIHKISKPITLAMLNEYLRKLFIDRIPAQVRDYQAVLEAFPADVLVVEFCTHGARCFSDLTGLPYATLGINPLVTPDPEIPPWASGEQPPRTCLGRWWNRLRHLLGVWLLISKLSAALNEERQRLGLTPSDPRTAYVDEVRSPDLHIQMTTPAFEFPRKNLPPAVRFVGPLLPAFADADFALPPWWDEMLAHPRQQVVHLTQGTVNTDANKLIKPTIRALADRDDLLIVVTGRNLDSVFRTSAEVATVSQESDSDDTRIEKPANVRTAAFIPHLKLLQHVGVMVTNAGYNGVLAALSCGVPPVCAGRSEDKADVSSRVAWAGAGVDLHTGTPTEAAVRRAVLRVVANGRYREAAARIRDDFARHNGPAEAVDALERLAKQSSSGGDVDGVGRGCHGPKR